MQRLVVARLGFSTAQGDSAGGPITTQATAWVQAPLLSTICVGGIVGKATASFKVRPGVKRPYSNILHTRSKVRLLSYQCGGPLGKRGASLWYWRGTGASPASRHVGMSLHLKRRAEPYSPGFPPTGLYAKPRFLDIKTRSKHLCDKQPGATNSQKH